MTNLPEFLLARIAEDEEAAQRCATWRDTAPSLAGCDGHHDPDRVLAECESKRLIVEAEPERWILQPDAPGHTVDMATPEGMVRVYGKLITELEYRDRYMDLATPSQTLLYLALPYVDHPDFREEWKP